MSTEKYNGWANIATWNVALWLQNDEELYQIASASPNWTTCQALLRIAEIAQTPDGYSYEDSSIDAQEMDEMIRELRN